MPELNRQPWLPGKRDASAVLRGNWVATLRRFVRSSDSERCEFCGTGLVARHPHLIEPAARRLVCACEACASAVATTADRSYRLVANRARLLTDFQMTDAEWEALRLPIDVTFLFHSTPQGRPVAFYPGPAGATESLLGLDAWDQLIAHNPALSDLEPDVEALLVNRLDGAREYYRVSIDWCFALVGLIRTHWRGLSGGPEAWQAIGDFFDRLRGPAASLQAWGHD